MLRRWSSLLGACACWFLSGPKQLKQTEATQPRGTHVKHLPDTENGATWSVLTVALTMTTALTELLMAKGRVLGGVLHLGHGMRRI